MRSILFAALLVSTASMAAPLRMKSLPPQAPADAKPNPDLSDEDVRSQMAANLGSIDTPIPASRWKALGLRVEAPLLAVVNSEALPTRRARAIDGLSAIGTSHTELLHTIASNEQEAYVVRYAAMRGLGNLLPAPQLVGQLAPVLNTAKDPRVRAAAGLVMAGNSPSSCSAVKAQIRREAAETRGYFERAMDACFAK